MKVELTHPIIHDGVEYSRGVHELDEATAQHFLKTAPQAAQPLRDAAVRVGKQTPLPNVRQSAEEKSAKLKG